MMDWVIIGGGIHGVHLAASLIGHGRTSRERLRILDPESELLGRWKSCTKTTGMTHLRSPMVHHIDLNPWSLKRFSKSFRGARPFAPPYDRPSLELFNAHCEQVISTYELDELHVQARVLRLDHSADKIEVHTKGEVIESKNVVLAIGASAQPTIPDWARGKKSGVHHIFEPFGELGETVAIVGAGISGAQLAIRLQQEGRRVILVSRHELRRHQFDSDPGWLGPMKMGAFSSQSDLDARRSIIRKARYKGSVPPDVLSRLNHAITWGKIEWFQSDVESLRETDSGLELRLESGDSLSVDSVIMATGFESTRPGGPLVDALIEEWNLPCAKCGYPIVDHALRWHPQVYVSGPLAELEVGPVSRNIAGARRAAERILSVSV